MGGRSSAAGSGAPTAELPSTPGPSGYADPMMNRQIRREQAKLDKKTAKEKLKKRSARRAKIQSLRQRREIRGASSRARTAATRVARDPSVPLTPEQRKKMPGRFSGILMMATVLFIVLQAAVPTREAGTLSSITGAGFFLLFAYFSLLYLERRGAPRPLQMTLLSGLLLAVGVTVARWLQPELGVDWLMSGLAVPGVVAGAYLGRLVFYNTPS